MDAGVQPDSPQHYSVDADHNDSPLDIHPGGQINTPGATAAAVSIQSIIPATYAQTTNYNPPPNNAQWPLTYAVTPLPEDSTHVLPAPVTSATSPADISQLSVPSPELSHGVSLGQASFRIGATPSYVAATTIDTLSMSADASMDSSFTTMPDMDTMTMTTGLSQSAVLASPSPVSNAASQSTAIFVTSTETFNPPLTSSPSVLASTFASATISVLPVSSEPFSTPVVFSLSSFISATSVLSESADVSSLPSLESSYRSSVLSFATFSLSESSGSSFQSSTTPFVSSTTSIESLSTTLSTTPFTTRSRTRTRTSTTSTTPTTTSTTTPSTSTVHSTTPNTSATSSTSSQSAFTPAQTTDPPTSSSNVVSTGHGTLFYLGVVFGVIIFIAFISAMIAWAIRLRSRALRRRDEWEAAIPWVKGDPDRTDDMDHLEAGRNEGLNGLRNGAHGGGGGAGAAGSSSIITGAGAAGVGIFQSPWSPRHGSNYQQTLGESKPFDADMYRPGNSPGRMRKLPSHLVDKELASRVQMEASNYPVVGRFPGSSAASNNGHPIDPMNELGAPREAHCMPRFFHEGRGFDSNASADMRPSIATRIRNLNRPAREDSLENLPPLPTPGAHLNQATEQNWAASWKAGLSNAFTAMSSRFSLANTSATAVNSRIEAEEVADRFTRAPSKGALRRSLQGDRYGSSEKLALTRGGSRSTTASKAWTLEEREDGAGVVHLRVPEDDIIDEKYEYAPAAMRPGLNGQNLSFGDGKNFGNADDFSSEEGYGASPAAQAEHIPLVASSKPQRALVNPRSVRRAGKGTSDESEYFSVISRQTTRSSIYSPQPSGYSDPRAIPPTKLALVPSQGVPYIPSARDQDAHNIPTPTREDDSVVLQPDEDSFLDRESSMHASMMTTSTGDTKERERYDGVGDALKTRRKGVVGVGRS